MDGVISSSTLVYMLNHFWLTFLVVIGMVLVSRSVVAGTRYSPILIIVVFGLVMGFIMVSTDLASPGLPEFPMVDLTSKVTLIALIASFFVGGQEIRKLIGGKTIDPNDIVVLSTKELFLGTKVPQFVFIIRAFFILVGIESIRRAILGVTTGSDLDGLYPLFGYLGLIASVILIDPTSQISSKSRYIKKGLIETIIILLILIGAFFVAQLVRPVIALPEIFFAMTFSVSFGLLLPNWKFGPTIRALLFAGIPVVLAANFMIGGSRIADAFQLQGMTSVISFGFFGQLMWMFGGLAILIFLAKANNIRNLAPGMAGSLSHAGLTGACTAGDLGEKAAVRAPIMINIPFVCHIFVFSILAASLAAGELIMSLSLMALLAGIIFTYLAIKTLRKANGSDKVEIRGLMLFSLGWQLVAFFGGLIILALGGMGLADAAMANSSAISHFGLFAAIQGGMFGPEAAGMIAFVFAMPFLAHPLVFGIFGKTAENNGVMPTKIVLALAAIGVIGVTTALFV